MTTPVMQVWKLISEEGNMKQIIGYRAKAFYPSSMRTGVISAAAALALAAGGVVLAAPPSGTGNPRYTEGPINNGVSLTGGEFSDSISGKVQGVGDNDLTFRVQADVVVLYACQNNGGNFPADPKKQAGADELQTDVKVDPTNGKASFAATLIQPAPTLTCPGGQHPEAVCAEFANKRVTVLVFGTDTVVIPETPAEPASDDLIRFTRFTDECNTLFATNP